MTEVTDPDRIFALTHAPDDRRDALAALWALDERLGAIVATTTQPLIGQMRLTWWHDALISLNEKPVSGEPLLSALHAHGFDGAALSTMIDGWEVLLDEPVDDAALRTHADRRGARLFTLSAAVLDAEVPEPAGQGWALADFAVRYADPAVSARAWQMARDVLKGLPTGRLPRPLRILLRLTAEDAVRGGRGKRPLWRLIAATW